MYHYVRGKGWVFGALIPAFVLHHDNKYALIYVRDVPEGCKRSPCGQRRFPESLEEELRLRVESLDDYYIGPSFNANNSVCAVFLKDLCTTT